MTTAAPPAISFFVHGTPVTKGSLRVWHSWRPDGKCMSGISEHNGGRLKEWRALVATAAKRRMGHEPPMVGPLECILHFYFPSPKSEPRDGYAWGLNRNDLDKLERAILDALTDAAVWRDDSQVSRLAAEKRYVDAEHPAGVMVSVAAL